jgi:hypothetical protein
VVCSDNNLTTGITIWDISTGEELSHRPTCASPPHGLVCLGHQFLVAAQVQKPGSYRGGAIFIWALNKVWCDMVLYLFVFFSLRGNIYSQFSTTSCDYNKIYRVDENIVET